MFKFMKLQALAALTVALFVIPAAAQEPAGPHAWIAEDFSNGIDAWREQRLDRRSTEYRVIEMGGDAVLQASSRNAAAALLLPVAPGPPYPVTIRWRWRVGSSLTDNSAEIEKDGDDYAARVFVIFGDAEFDSDTRALAYAWAGQQPVGSVYPNPYVSEVATIVLRSGNRDAGQWVGEERDIAADYQRAFGELPPDVAAIALLVDTDDTQTKAVTWFDDLELFTKPPKTLMSTP